MILRFDKPDARFLGDDRHRLHGEVGMGIDPRSHGRSAQRKLDEAIDGFAAALHAEPRLLGIAGHLLTEADGRGILQMRASDLDDVVEGGGLGIQGLL